MIDIVAIAVVLIVAAALLRLARRTPQRRHTIISAPITHPPLELYRSPVGGSYLPGRGHTCWHVFCRGRWYELYDLDGVHPVTAVPYGPTANRDLLGERVEWHELPARIAATVRELASGPDSTRART